MRLRGVSHHSDGGREGRAISFGAHALETELHRLIGGNHDCRSFSHSCSDPFCRAAQTIGPPRVCVCVCLCVCVCVRVCV
jgi:hypothetical protein